MTDFSHLDAIIARLGRERARQAQHPSEWRALQVASAERELAAEYAFLGIDPNLSADDIFNELTQEV